MKNKNKRLDTIKLIISTKEIGSQEELRVELENEGFNLTQATLSRDLKQLKVAKAATMGGKYVYVLPNNTLYKRVNTPWQDDDNSPRNVGFQSIVFSGNIAVIKTRPGYASSLAYDIDALNLEEVCGTIAGDDTIMLIMKERSSRIQLIHGLEKLIPGIR
ncbi:MAG: arginine repressor [Bacteroidaceae bacterium]|nr:arginine repressor [Bacteroidaceae bacterium]